MTDLSALHEQYELIRHTEGRNNLNYAIMHADGKVSLCPQRMCWAAIYEGGSVCTDQHLKSPLDIGMYGYLTSSAPYEYIKSTTKRSASRSVGVVSYQLAIKRLFAHYKNLLVPDSFANRMRDGFIVKLKDAPFTAEQVGAFLVFYRNLGEQHFHYMFNALINEGFTFEQAAIWSCFIRKNNGAIDLGRGYHTLFSKGAYYTALKDLKKMLDGRSPFHLSDDTPPLEPTRAVGWNFKDTYTPTEWTGSNQTLTWALGGLYKYEDFVKFAKEFQNA